jgi:RNA recognition motif-containing protein
MPPRGTAAVYGKIASNDINQKHKKGHQMAKELYVGHISENASEEDVRKLFSVMGTVTSVHLIVDPDTGEFKRCGYVRMESGIDLKEVVETLDGALLIDRVITVSVARPQKPGMSKTGRPGAAGGKRKAGGPRATAPAVKGPVKGPRGPKGGGRPGGTRGSKQR